MSVRQRLSRLNIAQQLALLLTACVLVGALVVGAVLAYNLRAGFDDYLRAKDVAQAQRFAAFFAEQAQSEAFVEKLRGSPEAMRSLLGQFSQREGLAVRPGPPDRGYGGAIRPRTPDVSGLGPPGWQGESPALRTGPPDSEAGTDDRGRPSGPPASPRGGAPTAPLGGAIGPRLQIFDAQGRWVAGRPQPRGAAYFVTPVTVQGRLIAQVRVTEEHSKEQVDAHFLQRQYWGLLGAILTVSLLAAGVAVGVARRWSQPLRAVQSATRRIADGAFDVRLELSGAKELTELAQDVNRMGRVLGEMAASRKRWIAQTAHELRTPLAVLQGEIESAEDGVRQPSAQWLERLLGEVKQLTRLVQDLHTLSVNDMDRPALELSSVDAGLLVRSAHERHCQRLRAQGIELELEAAETAAVRWDVGRVAQILDNLIENSRRYTHPPGRCCISGVALAGMYRIRVEDSPPGVAEAELALLFEPLYRADAARTRQTGADRASSSSGLGLAIVKAMVQAHGGQVTASASRLGGLRLEVLLPLQAPDALGKSKA